MLPKISIFNQALHSVQSGHPWLFESQATHDCPAGEPILLVAGNSNKIIGFGLADTGDISVRVLGKNPMQISFLLKERIAMAAHFRQSMARKDTDCYRLINGAGDGLPGIIADRYADTIVLRLYSKAWIRYIDIMIQEFKKLEGISRVYRKFGVRLVDGKKGGETLAGSPLPEYLIATEYGLKFIVRPKEGQKTGLFLDQREHRRLIGEISQDKTVVNLFSYNGGFSLYAAKGGAKRVYSVDISASALEDAKENLISEGDYVCLESPRGKVDVKARITDEVKSGILSTTFHFPEIMINNLTGDIHDSEAMCPEYKVVAVRIRKSKGKYKPAVV